jgi:hypothetical protein
MRLQDRGAKMAYLVQTKAEANEVDSPNEGVMTLFHMHEFSPSFGKYCREVHRSGVNSKEAAATGRIRPSAVFCLHCTVVALACGLCMAFSQR